jgi:hypothetical protein
LVLAGKCPKPEVISPCKCEFYSKPIYPTEELIKGNGIFCGGDNKFDLRKIFVTLSGTLSGDEEKHFSILVINNTAISELEKDALHDITFDSIWLEHTPNLTLIHSKAFNATNMKTKYFFLYYTHNIVNNPPEHNIFDIVSSFVNLILFDLISTKITKIPSKAFMPLNGVQSNLKYAKFFEGSIESIENYAFHELNNLVEIELFHNKLAYIPAHAFEFQKPSNQLLKLSLEENKLNGSSFEVGVFTNANRPLNIVLTRNNITFLEEKTFLPFLKLSDQNKIGIQQNPINCTDCRNRWLFREGTQILHKIEGNCTGGKSIQSLSAHDFEHCKL